MTDRNFVLRWAHLGLGRNPQHREISEEQRRAFEAHVADIQAEQGQKSAELAARKRVPSTACGLRFPLVTPRASRAHSGPAE